ncbi:hypothetical protein [Actinokineospora sp.]|uniref:hypothetical protein n=1 Tax=Actinokineospora sp. TaxID=1872133 RepID=UPI0040378001
MTQPQTLPPVAAEARALLCSLLYEHVETVEYIVDKDEPWTEEQCGVIRSAIEDLGLVIRQMVTEHGNTQRGDNCSTCAVPWPCATLASLYRMLTDRQLGFVRLLEENATPPKRT